MSFDKGDLVRAKHKARFYSSIDCEQSRVGPSLDEGSRKSRERSLRESQKVEHHLLLARATTTTTASTASTATIGRSSVSGLTRARVVVVGRAVAVLVVVRPVGVGVVVATTRGGRGPASAVVVALAVGTGGADVGHGGRVKEW